MCTLTHSISNSVLQFRPRMVIIDEGSQVIPAEFFARLFPSAESSFLTGVDSVVVFGDSQQLPPQLFNTTLFENVDHNVWEHYRNNLELSLQSLLIENLPAKNKFALNVCVIKKNRILIPPHLHACKFNFFLGLSPRARAAF